MRMLIIGGGRTGENLARTLQKKKHEVIVIERDRDRCTRLADVLGTAVCCGDGSNVTTLEQAGAENADCVIAVTGIDPDNLVAAQLAQAHFHAKKVIARVNDPRNVETFRNLGIENVVCSAEMLTRMIEQEADREHMHLIAGLNQGKAGICSYTLPQNSALHGKALCDLALPHGSLLISVIRAGELIIPNGSTTLCRGDELVAVATEPVQKQLMRTLAETERENF